MSTEIPTELALEITDCREVELIVETSEGELFLSLAEEFQGLNVTSFTFEKNARSIKNAKSLISELQNWVATTL